MTTPPAPGDANALGPAELAIRLLVDLGRLEAEAGHLAGAYCKGYPFPHIVIDDLLLMDPVETSTVPPPEWEGWRSLGDSYQLSKLYCQDIDRIPQPFSALIDQLSRPRFLTVLSRITGVDRLLPDPYLTGGGLHLSGPGGVLAPHTDFHWYSDQALYRRVNVIFYLNDSWSESDGGCLELWSDDNGSDRTTIVPTWGRCVVFTTDDRSIHGFPVPIAEGRWRRSLALYYYTAEEADVFSGDTTTYWRTHGQHTGVRRARLSAYHGLIKISRGFSILAQLANPNQGVQTWWADRRQRHGASTTSRQFDESGPRPPTAT